MVVCKCMRWRETERDRDREKVRERKIAFPFGRVNEFSLVHQLTITANTHCFSNGCSAFTNTH